MRRMLWSLLAVLPVVAFAQDENRFRCTQGDLVRRVEIARETDAAVPCAVRYYKDTEAPGEGPQVLFNARNEVGYCEARAREFVARLETLGWTCASVAQASAAED